MPGRQSKASRTPLSTFASGWGGVGEVLPSVEGPAPRGKALKGACISNKPLKELYNPVHLAMLRPLCYLLRRQPLRAALPTALHAAQLHLMKYAV